MRLNRFELRGSIREVPPGERAAADHLSGVPGHVAPYDGAVEIGEPQADRAADVATAPLKRQKADDLAVAFQPRDLDVVPDRGDGQRVVRREEGTVEPGKASLEPAPDREL